MPRAVLFMWGDLYAALHHNSAYVPHVWCWWGSSAPQSMAAVLWNTPLKPQFISQMSHPFILCSPPTRLLYNILFILLVLIESVAKDVNSSFEYSRWYTVSQPYLLVLFQVEPQRCVRRSSGTRFVLLGKWPESSQSSGLTLSLILSLWCTSSFLMITLWKLEKASVHVLYIWITMSSGRGSELPYWIAGHRRARKMQECWWNEWSQLSAQSSCVWKHHVALLGLMSWHEMSHDAPRLYNDIRHYSRLMLLPLPCRTAASGQPVSQTSAWVNCSKGWN